MQNTLRFRLLAAGLLLASSAAPVAAQRFAPPMPPGEVRWFLEDDGYVVLAPPRLRGDIYVVEVVDRRDRRARLVVDAYRGYVVERVTLAGRAAGEPPEFAYPGRGGRWGESPRDREADLGWMPRRGEPDEWRDDPEFRPGDPPRRAEDRRDSPERQKRLASRPEPRLPQAAPLPPVRPLAQESVRAPDAPPAEKREPAPETQARLQPPAEPRIQIPPLPEVESLTQAPAELLPEEEEQIIQAPAEAKRDL